MAKKIKEKRINRRFKVIDVIVECEPSSLFSIFNKKGGKVGKIKDLSVLGAQVILKEKPPAQDATIKLDFDVPAFADTIKVRGKVQWSTYDARLKLYRVGVFFRNLDEKNAKRLRMLEGDPSLQVLSRPAYRKKTR